MSEVPLYGLVLMSEVPLYSETPPRPVRLSRGPPREVTLLFSSSLLLSSLELSDTQVYEP